MKEKTETNPKGAGAPEGHTNSSKNNRIWGNIIKKYAVQEDYKRLHAMAEKLYEKAAEGDLAAIKEVGDRLDGRPTQQIDQITEHSGEVTYTWKK
jgi:hypothetical protein